ncbi:hypothetical protein [Arcobacter sp. FWKO B]|uniref:hypothetical protein n=1 Tax=Arcobacter sp. FWKO B TaxID=2593672 RepID=UPI0018A58BA2|nr:hypothetical protein [Arcobacter sp. FWKO B]QOG11842.1 hypothetical protein FWKOB_03625 [Arcobacter sp. FWKO B]
MAKRKKLNSNSEQKNFFLNIAKLKNPIRITKYLKENAPKHLVENNFSKLISHPLMKNNILGSTFPINYKDIETEVIVSQGTLEQEVWWTYLNVIYHYEKINFFIYKSEQFNNLLLYAKYEDASNILNEIKYELGLSHWYIENKLLLLSKMNGLKEQKEYAETIKKELPDASALLVYHFSQKLENELSYEQYDKNFKKMWRDYPNIKTYFEFKVNSLNAAPENLVYFLYFERESPTIDKYISLKKALFAICSNNNYYNLPVDFLNKYLIKLDNKIKDIELKPLLIKSTKLNYNDINIDNNKYIRILDLYTMGHYKESYDLCLKELENYLTFNINLIEILIKSEIRYAVDDSFIELPINKNSIIFNIYEYYKSIILKDQNLINSINKLLKIALELSSLSISTMITQFIYKNVPFYNIPVADSSLNTGGLHTFLYDVREQSIIDDARYRILITDMQKTYQESITYQLLNKKNFNIDKKIPSFRLQKYTIKINPETIPKEQQIEIYKGIIKNGNILDKYYAIVELSYLYFKYKEIQNCIKAIVEGYLFNKSLIYNLPLQEIIEYIEQYHSTDFDKDIETPILYELYSKYISNKFDSQKMIRYEVFLEENGYTKPSELINNYERFDKNKLDFFLQFNCKSQILDSSIYFENTEEVESERINICQFLVEQKVSSSHILLKEIKNITEQSLISKYIQVIEQNKIYVNEEGIKSKLQSNLAEYYLRYIDLVKNSTTLKRDLNNKVFFNNAFGVNIPYPKNDIIPLLQNALSDVKEYFVLSNEYGLNGFISTNIRHGKLYNFLTSSLIKSNLFIKPNDDYWQKNFQIDVQISHILTNFSNDIDKSINDFKDQYIQVVTEKENTKNGLFKYNLTDEICIAIYNQLDEEPSYEEFENKLFEVLWLQTEKNLEDIRSKISNELIKNIKLIFENLNIQIESIDNKYNLSNIRDIIRHESTILQRNLETLKQWFTRQTISSIADFEFTLPVSITKEVIKNVHANNFIKLNADIKIKDKFKGLFLKGFVDILYILFDNAIKHSDSECEEINLLLDKSNKKQYEYRLYVANQIKENLNIELNTQKIEEIRDNIRNKMYGQSVGTEGGTGFYKIVKILTYDMVMGNRFIDFYYHGDKFIVEIHFGKNKE